MALNTWWSDPSQRYWMEITHRDVGANLQSPKLAQGQWSYDLVSHVQAGDRVLHWKSGGTPNEEVERGTGRLQAASIRRAGSAGVAPAVRASVEPGSHPEPA